MALLTRIIIVKVIFTFLIIGSVYAQKGTAQYFSKEQKVSDEDQYVDTLKKQIKIAIENGAIDSAYGVLKSLEMSGFTARNKIKIYLLTGELYEVHNAIDSAIYFYNHALDLAIQNNYGELAGLAYGNMGSMQLYMNNDDKAYALFKKAIPYLMRANSNYQLSIIYNNLGIYFKRIQQNDSVRFYYHEAINIRKNSGFEDKLSSIYLNLGSLELSEKRYVEAKQNLFLALKYAQRYDNTTDELLIYINLGNINYTLKIYDKAEFYYIKGIEIVESGEFPFYKKYLYYYMSKLYETKKDFETSLKYNRLYVKASEDYITQEKDAKVLELQEKYENERILKENIVLERNTEEKEYLLEQKTIESQNRILIILVISLLSFIILISLGIIYYYYRKKNHQNKQLTSLLAEREILLNEIHHRVKNNLQIIISLLNLQKGNTNVDTLIQDFKSRISSMLILHENLYQSKNLKEIKLEEYINDFLENFQNTFIKQEGEIKITKEIDEVIIDINKVVPLGLILNELLTNAVKYAFIEKDSPELKIILKRHDNITYLSIIDNGKGLDDDFEFNSTQSFGLKLVKGLVRQIKGNVNFINSKEGLTISIEFENVSTK